MFAQIAKQSMKRFFSRRNCSLKFFQSEESYRKFLYNVLIRNQSRWSDGEKVEGGVAMEAKRTSQVSTKSELGKRMYNYSELGKYSSDDDVFGDNKWKFELEWLIKAIEPASQFCRWALPTGNGTQNKSAPSGRSLMEIISDIQRCKLGLPDWSLSDLTIGLYLIYLRQESTNPFADVKGIRINSDTIVHDLIYHIELAKGAYRGNAAGLARISMLQEGHIVKFVKDSSVMRPGYFIGIDIRKRLVILGIRGTHTVYDLVTDIVSSSSEEITFEGYSSHFGSAEAARWFISHEMGTIKRCLDRYKGFGLRLVGHSLGAATASLLAIMLRKKSTEELGFDPSIVTAVGIATPPCVSRELAECCSDYITTVVMQDDIIPRLSVASLTRLRNEVLQTDWMTLLEKEDWGTAKDLVVNAKQVVSSVQDVARKLADFAKFRSPIKTFINDSRNKIHLVSSVSSSPKEAEENAVIGRKEEAICKAPELFVPGTFYYLKRNMDTQESSKSTEGIEFFTLWKTHPEEHFQRILLSSNIISDHKCDSHLYALRDVIKGIPGTLKESIY